MTVVQKSRRPQGLHDGYGDDRVSCDQCVRKDVLSREVAAERDCSSPLPGVWAQLPRFRELDPLGLPSPSGFFMRPFPGCGLRRPAAAAPLFGRRVPGTLSDSGGRSNVCRPAIAFGSSCQAVGRSGPVARE